MPDGSHPTLTEVAARARVSTATVSRVLNGRPGVAEATRQRVVRLLAEVGYRPGDLTSAQLVGLIAPRLEDDAAGLVQATQAALGAADVAPVLCTHHEAGGVAWAIDTALRRRVAGVIVIGPARLTDADLAALHRVEAAGLPLVLIDLPATVGTRQIGTDIDAGVDRAVRHLTAMGHRRLGLLAEPFADRQPEAFRRAAPSGEVRVAPATMASAIEAAGALLDAGVTAVLAGSDLLAVAILRAAAARRLDVPRDLSVVAAVDSPLAAYAEPALDALRLPTRAVAEAVVDALVARIDRSRPARGQAVAGAASPAPLLFAPELVVRGSTAALSRRD